MEPHPGRPTSSAVRRFPRGDPGAGGHARPGRSSGGRVRDRHPWSSGLGAGATASRSWWRRCRTSSTASSTSGSRRLLSTLPPVEQAVFDVSGGVAASVASTSVDTRVEAQGDLRPHPPAGVSVGGRVAWLRGVEPASRPASAGWRLSPSPPVRGRPLLRPPLPVMPGRLAREAARWSDGAVRRRLAESCTRRGDGAPRKALVVEDHPDARALVRTYLLAMGLEVVDVGRGPLRHPRPQATRAGSGVPRSDAARAERIRGLRVHARASPSCGTSRSW